jgi:hypothetical protein
MRIAAPREPRFFVGRQFERRTRLSSGLPAKSGFCRLVIFLPGNLLGANSQTSGSARHIKLLISLPTRCLHRS